MFSSRAVGRAVARSFISRRGGWSAEGGSESQDVDVSALEENSGRKPRVD